MPDRPRSRSRGAQSSEYDHREVRPSRRSTRYAGARTALLVTFALAGCGGSNEPKLDPAEVIDRAVRATAAEDSFRFRFETENPPRAASGLNLTFAEGEVSVPDRLRADVAGTFAGIPLESELVAIGRDEWLENPFGGGFREIDIGVSPLDFFDPDTGVLAVLRNARDIELSEDGDEYVVKGDVSADNVETFLGVDADSRPLDVEVTVAKDDFLLRRLEVIGPANDGEANDVRRVLELSDYGAEVDVSAPM